MQRVFSGVCEAALALPPAALGAQASANLANAVPRLGALAGPRSVQAQLLTHLASATLASPHGQLLPRHAAQLLNALSRHRAASSSSSDDSDDSGRVVVPRGLGAHLAAALRGAGPQGASAQDLGLISHSPTLNFAIYIFLVCTYS